MCKQVPYNRKIEGAGGSSAPTSWPRYLHIGGKRERVCKMSYLYNNLNNELYLQDRTSTYSIAKAIYNYVLRISTKI